MQTEIRARKSVKRDKMRTAHLRTREGLCEQVTVQWSQEGAAGQTEPRARGSRFPKASREAEQLTLGRDRESSPGRWHRQGLGSLPGGR